MANRVVRTPSDRRLAETVFVTDPTTYETVVLKAGTEVSDPALADQITHPSAWAPGHSAAITPPKAEEAPSPEADVEARTSTPAPARSSKRPRPAS